MIKHRALTGVIAVLGVLCLLTGAINLWFGFSHRRLDTSQPLPPVSTVRPQVPQQVATPDQLQQLLEHKRIEEAEAEEALNAARERLEELRANFEKGAATIEAQNSVNALEQRERDLRSAVGLLAQDMERAKLANSLESDEYQKVVDAALARLRTANIAFNTPKTIDIAKPRRIGLVVSFDTPAPALREVIEPNGPLETASVNAAPEMEAVLTASAGLAITPLQSNSPQAVPSRGITYWNWDVEGKVGGSQSLTLTISAVFSMTPGAPRHTMQVFKRELTVQVSPPVRVLEFVTSNWQWLWGVLAVPLAGWLWRRFQPPKPTLTNTWRPWRRRARQGM